jgi:hypothetical protein
VTDLLPDLDQSPPAEGDLHLQKVSNQWQFSFGSEIYNRGLGDMTIRGERPDTATPTMQIVQTLQRSDGSTRDVAVGGALQYVTGNHLHWHVLGLEHYELRNLADPSKVATDHKTGFCMADKSPDYCGANHPEYLAVSEGIKVSTAPNNGYDYYLPTLEGQYVNIDPVATPAGRYSLTHRSNVDHALLESRYDNNGASAEIQLNWSANGTPSYKYIQSCADSEVCGPTPDPPANPPPKDPDPQPQPQPDPQPQPEPQPEPAPFVPPLTVEQTALGPKVVMSRVDAIRLMREAIHKTQKREPRALHPRCGRLGAARFTCRGVWHVRGLRWKGSAKVWYRLSGRKLVWYYTLDARHGTKHISADSARGGSRAAWAASLLNRDLRCHRVTELGRS